MGGEIVKIYTYSEARQSLATLLDLARREGRVCIRRRDGQLFDLQPATEPESPLDVPAVKVRLRSGELERLVREGRRSADRLWRATRSQPTREARRHAPRRKPE